MAKEKDNKKEITTSKKRNKKGNSHKEKDQFIIETLVDRISSLKRGTDRLLTLYIFIILYAIIHTQDFGQINLVLELDFNSDDGDLYHLTIVGLLTLIFSLIGFHLIEYAVKREELDIRFLNIHKSDVGDKVEDMSKEEAERRYNEVSKTMIPSSMYEIMYSLDIYSKIRKDFLRQLPAYTILGFLLAGHVISIIHLSLIDASLKFLIPTGLLLVLFWGLHYYVFVNSHRRVRQTLGKMLRKRILLTLGVFALGIIIWLILK